MFTEHTKQVTNVNSEPRAIRFRILVVAVCGLFLSGPLFAQSFDSANTSTGSILGTVTDDNSDPIPGAAITLQGSGANRLTTKTDGDGSFALHGVATGTSYQIAVTANGFADWSSIVALAPGQEKNLGEIMLRVLTVQRAITVNYSSKEVAEQQLKAEEHQRVLGFIPNIFVTYEPHPEPLTAKMKFHLAYKGLTHPTFFSFEALWSGFEQAGHFPNYPLGMKGYGERLGANLANETTEGLVGNALLPSLLHQDPRYFYRGSGTKKSRAWHAFLAPFVCEGDNGKPQPNYSQWGGSLISASLSNAYYPASDRGAGLVFQNFGISMGLHVTLGLAQEFVLGRFTSKRAH
jgi:hypothetical protein